MLILSTLALCVTITWGASACEIAASPCVAYRGFAKAQINQDAVIRLTEWREESGETLAKPRYITLFDVSQHSATPRFHVIDTEEKSITTYLAAHGKGSDKDHDGWADAFSDIPGSKATPLGFFKTAETYYGKHGYSLRLDGLESRNANARSRSIVIHGADYVDPARQRLGRSWGCPALSTKDAKHVIDLIKGGSLLYIHNGAAP